MIRRLLTLRIGSRFTLTAIRVDVQNESVRFAGSVNDMRRIFATIIIMAFVAKTSAQSTPNDIVIRQSTVEVRGGQSSIFPVTGYLRQGQAIRILREEKEWLAIAPPAGSSSWVMERVLDKQPARGQRTICVLLADDAPVQLGIAESAGPLPHEVAKTKRGLQVIVLGEKAISDLLGEKTTWWRIQPVPSEVRWVAKESVQGTDMRSQESGVRDQRSKVSGQTVGQSPTASKTMQPVARPSYAPVQPARGVIMTSGPGNLRRAAFQIDGQPAFVLEDYQGYARVYAIAQSGLNLEPFVNRRVELFGPMVQRAEFTGKGYMSVNRLHLLR
jgi:SH3-like domain-containing protein